jgi:hypothetical protein
LPATPHKPLQASGLLYLTSLETGDPGEDSFSVYDPLADAWTTLTAYDTGCRMATSAGGQLYAHGFTNTIDVYDPATDTWSVVMAAPGGSSGSSATWRSPTPVSSCTQIRV